MAVYKRNYRGYQGALTPDWSRFLILARYAWRDVRASRFLNMFLLAACFFPIAFAVFIYVKYHLDAISTQFGFRVPQMNDIEPRTFMVFLNIQAFFAWLLTAFIGPRLMAPDLGNNALPLYFCRPLSRAEYVFGKASVLLILISTITWIPGLMLFGMEASLAGAAWLQKYLWLARAMFVGGVLLAVVLTVTALAIAAWVKWRIAASAAILALSFVTAAVAQMINAVLRTTAGHWVDIGWLVSRVWLDLFGRNLGSTQDFTIADAWSGILAFCTVSLLILWRKVRAYEVVA
jgi:ABC-2 type transport system permease protein